MRLLKPTLALTLFYINVVHCLLIPCVINTWNFSNGATKAWQVLNTPDGSALDAVEAGCSECESDQCDGTVGYGGSPDENGETTLDALIMDGTTHDAGAVAALRRVKSAISVARKVLENTQHTLLVGDQATQFALEMGFKEESLSTNKSLQMWKDWKKNSCQPNFWKNVNPDSKEKCGPYKPKPGPNSVFGPDNHDTIGMIAIDAQGHIAGGTSSNGAAHKIPGRVGDSPIPGSGAYVDEDVGGAAATGDGDVMMRFLPSYQAVEYMRQGYSPMEAASLALVRIISKHPSFMGALVTLNMNGNYGAACHGMKEFPFSISNPSTGQVVVKKINCL